MRSEHKHHPYSIWIKFCRGPLSVGELGSLVVPCQSGSWKQLPSGGDAVMYLSGVPGWGYTPAPCPSGWTEIAYQGTLTDTYWTSPSGYSYTRTCTKVAARMPIYLTSVQGISGASANCPSGWTQADYEVVRGLPGYTTPFAYVNVRTCY